MIRKLNTKNERRKIKKKDFDKMVEALLRMTPPKN